MVCWCCCCLISSLQPSAVPHVAHKLGHPMISKIAVFWATDRFKHFSKQSPFLVWKFTEVIGKAIIFLLYTASSSVVSIPFTYKAPAKQSCPPFINKPTCIKGQWLNQQLADQFLFAHFAPPNPKTIFVHLRSAAPENVSSRRSKWNAVASQTPWAACWAAARRVWCFVKAAGKTPICACRDHFASAFGWPNRQWWHFEGKYGNIHLNLDV